MEPTIDTRTGLGDLLERVLDRGVFVKLDLIISVAGIPLVGLSLHAALASIETMNAYGMFGDWDTSTRAEAALAQGSAKIRLEVGETVVFEEFAMVRSDEGIMRTWRPGRAYLTDRRLLLVRRSPYEVLVSLEFGDIAGIGSYSLAESGVTSEVICLADVDGDMTLVRMGEPELFQASLADLLRRHDIQVTHIDDATLRAAFPDVSAESQLWHDMGDGLGWRAGWGAIAEGSFSFWSDFERRRIIDIPWADLQSVSVERRRLSEPLGERDVLCLLRRDDQDEYTFTGANVEQWAAAIRQAKSRSRGLDS